MVKLKNFNFTILGNTYNVTGERYNANLSMNVDWFGKNQIAINRKIIKYDILR